MSRDRSGFDNTPFVWDNKYSLSTYYLRWFRTLVLNNLNSTSLIWAAYYLGSFNRIFQVCDFSRFPFSFSEIASVPFLKETYARILNFLWILLNSLYLTVYLSKGFRWWLCSLKGTSRLSRSSSFKSYWWLRFSSFKDFVNKGCAPKGHRSLRFFSFRRNFVSLSWFIHSKKQTFIPT